jgi:hypothetical protein
MNGQRKKEFHALSERPTDNPLNRSGRERPNDKKTVAIMHLPVLRRSLLVPLRQVSWLGGRSGRLHHRFCLPQLNEPSGASKQFSSLTVAEPRRLFTGLPFCAHMGT